MSKLPPGITEDDLYPKDKVDPKSSQPSFAVPTRSFPAERAVSFNQAGGCSTIRAQPWRNRPHGFQDFAFGTDAPERFELFIMGDGEEKVTAVDETRVPNCVTFTFNKEDHTLGNLLRSQLLKDPKVLFAGYKVPHPLFPSFELRVQTTDETNPRAAVIKAAQDLIKDLTIFRNNFTREWELKKMIDPAKEGN
ncbi:DNA-directed RNA polymerase II core subunit [Orbilia oligospora]|uniref:DNA-directed RNA polymerase RBP11-like dimerisation domain-containing protein n=2 Tax=Orbilia oligospora TaxID=2813651 RepID=G1X7Y3_ARTOA|nr:hypothetical protein AOL_s00054g869 [Orbilia oligospora ATCC 24927]EGX50783.1 hypothetical protein AOL_s00054g869 [Orbilia oligospora ATCC 24927]KAF3142046.1 DNA-directed RNA polymerase II core subunit [Orbilia oligospora]KAF3282830.1 DNA-directed RNA polymerase II core subunit [Orbilia oligospora]KAF3315579.1 DNA-directed RNA polymerase II core subunit [Orbilia oligospora]